MCKGLHGGEREGFSKHPCAHAVGGMGFQEHLLENVRLEEMRDWYTVLSTVKIAA